VRASLTPSCGTATYPVTAFANASLWLRRSESETGWGDSQCLGQLDDRVEPRIDVAAGLQVGDGGLVYAGLTGQGGLREALSTPSVSDRKRFTHTAIIMPIWVNAVKVYFTFEGIPASLFPQASDLQRFVVEGKAYTRLS
jgi:hypothetical protein